MLRNAMGVKFAGKTRYVTLEWPIGSSRIVVSFAR